MKKQQSLLILALLCAGVLLAIILVNTEQSSPAITVATSSLKEDPTDPIYRQPATTATALYWQRETVISIMRTQNPPLPPSVVPATAQILETATGWVRYNTDLAIFGTDYVRTPIGLRTPSTLWFTFVPTIDTTLLFSSPTPTP